MPDHTSADTPDASGATAQTAENTGAFESRLRALLLRHHRELHALLQARSEPSAVAIGSGATEASVSTNAPALQQTASLHCAYNGTPTDAQLQECRALKNFQCDCSGTAAKGWRDVPGEGLRLKMTEALYGEGLGAEGRLERRALDKPPGIQESNPGHSPLDGRNTGIETLCVALPPLDTQKQGPA